MTRRVALPHDARTTSADGSTNGIKRQLGALELVQPTELRYREELARRIRHAASGAAAANLARAAAGARPLRRAGMFAATGDALIAKDGAVIAKTTYREWLAR